MAPSSPPNTRTRTRKIRSHVADLHEAIEATPIARRLEAGDVDPGTYRHLHGQLLHVHRAVDEALEEQRASLGNLLHEEDLRTGYLRDDLEALGALPPDPPAEPARSVHSRLEPPRPDRAYLMGILYVVKGARFGGKVLAEAVARALGVPVEPGGGLDYYLAGQDVLPRQWRAFLREVDALELGEEEEETLLEGARFLMEQHLALYESYE